jgi:hypothetical protein
VGNQLRRCTTFLHNLSPYLYLQRQKTPLHYCIPSGNAKARVLPGSRQYVRRAAALWPRSARPVVVGWAPHSLPTGLTPHYPHGGVYPSEEYSAVFFWDDPT